MLDIAIRGTLEENRPINYVIPAVGQLSSDTGKLGEVLRSFCLYSAKLLEVEHCAIYLEHSEKPSTLVVVADSKREPEASGVGTFIPVLEKRGGWTVETFRSARLHNCFGPDLQQPEIAVPYEVSHLRSPRSSLLAVPIFDQTPRSVGVFKLENKLPRGHLFKRAFNWNDEALGTLLASQISFLLETHRLLKSVFDLIGELSMPKGVRTVAQKCVSYAVALTNGLVGEVSCLDSSRAGEYPLRVQATAGPNQLKVGDIIPDPSICSAVVRDGKGRFEPDVKNARDYFPCNDLRSGGVSLRKMETELALPILLAGRSIGVLNVESTKPSNNGGLAESDSSVLRALADIVGIAEHTSNLQDALLYQLTQAGEASSLLDEMLASISQHTVFKKGIGYIVDYLRGHIKSVAYCECPKHELAFDFTEKHAAALAVSNGDIFYSRVPAKDANVNQKGLEQYLIEGSLITAPIVLRARKSPHVVAVVAMWTGRETFHIEDVKADLNRIRQITTLHVTLRPSDTV